MEVSAQTWTLDLGTHFQRATGCIPAPNNLAGYPDAVPVMEEPPPLSMPCAQAVDYARIQAHGWATLVEKSAEFVTYDVPPLPEHWSPQLIPCWFMDIATNVMTLVCLFPMGDLVNAPGFTIPREVQS